MNETALPPACAACEEALSAWIDGELDARRARAVEAHVVGCARCGLRAGSLRAVDVSLRALAEMARRPDEAARLARVAAQLATLRGADAEPLLRVAPNAVAASASGRRAAPPRGRRRSARLALGLAAAAAAVFGVLVVPRWFEPTPEPSVTAREATALRSETVAESAPRPPLPAGRAGPPTPGHLGASVPTEASRPAADDALAESRELGSADRPLVDRLDALEILPTLRDLTLAERRALAERLAPLRTPGPQEGERLLANLERWREMTSEQREQLRQRWRSLQQLTPAERERLFEGSPPSP